MTLTLSCIGHQIPCVRFGLVYGSQQVLPLDAMGRIVGSMRSIRPGPCLEGPYVLRQHRYLKQGVGVLFLTHIRYSQFVWGKGQICIVQSYRRWFHEVLGFCLEHKICITEQGLTALCA